MNDDLDFLKDLFKGPAEPLRKLSLFRGGEGIFCKCLEKYIQTELKDPRNEEGLLRVYCSYITKDEEEFFANVLFDLLPNAEDVFNNSTLFLNLEGISEQIGLSTERILDILIGLSRIKIEVNEEKLISSWIFPEHGGEVDFYEFNTKKEFRSACVEVRKEMAQ